LQNVTGTQTLVDMPNTKKSDLRRARSGMVNLCPTSTGSATAIVEIYPELKGKLNGLAVRVPLTNASLTDCVFEVNRTVTTEEVNAALKEASEHGPLKGILGFETAPLVSTDYTNDVRSSIIDAQSTMVINGTMIKIYAWYDNETGTQRLAPKRDVSACHHLSQRGLTLSFGNLRIQNQCIIVTGYSKRMAELCHIAAAVNIRNEAPAVKYE
jgi:glyceraldehyde 3-phosphate dehydrogenase